MEIIKFTVICLICTLILGLIFYNLAQFTVYQYELYVSTGLTVLAFPLALIISVLLASAYMENKANSVIMGLIVAVLAGFLQAPFISLVMGKLAGGWFNEYIGNQVFLLAVLAIVAAYVGNVYLKQRIR